MGFDVDSAALWPGPVLITCPEALLRNKELRADPFMAPSSIQPADGGVPSPSLALTTTKAAHKPLCRVPAFLLIACALLLATACRNRSDDSSVLDKVEAARVAAANPSNYGKPVRIKGVVTYCDPEWHLLFLQDASGGFFINLKDEVQGLEAGQLVEVSGKLAPGNRGIDDPDFRLLGPAPMPAPQPLPGCRAGAPELRPGYPALRRSALMDGGHATTRPIPTGPSPMR